MQSYKKLLTWQNFFPNFLHSTPKKNLHPQNSSTFFWATCTPHVGLKWSLQRMHSFSLYHRFPFITDLYHRFPFYHRFTLDLSFITDLYHRFIIDWPFRSSSFAPRQSSSKLDFALAAPSVEIKWRKWLRGVIPATCYLRAKLANIFPIFIPR